MAQYVVLEPAGADGAEKAKFVRDGFSVIALIIPFIWLLFQRLWFEAIVVILLGVALLMGATYLGLGNAAPILSFLLSIFVALEGANWKVAKLRRQGYVETAAIEASDEEEAEIRYFYQRQPSTAQPQMASPSPLSWADRSRQTNSNPNLGATIGFVGHRGEK